MDNSLKTKEKPPEEGLAPPAKGKTKTFLIGKKLKTTDLRQTAARRASGPGNKPKPNPPDSLRAGAGQAASRLLRCATALRVTLAPTLRLKALVWPKGSFRPVHTARTHNPPFPS